MNVEWLESVLLEGKFKYGVAKSRDSKPKSSKSGYTLKSTLCDLVAQVRGRELTNTAIFVFSATHYSFHPLYSLRGNICQEIIFLQSLNLNNKKR